MKYPPLSKNLFNDLTTYGLHQCNFQCFTKLTRVGTSVKNLLDLTAQSITQNLKTLDFSKVIINTVLKN